MPKIAMDFSDAPELTPVPSGDYSLEVVNIQVVASKGPKTAGQPMLKMHYKVIGGEFDNRRIFENLLPQGAAAWKWRQFLIGVYGKEIAGEVIEENDLDTDDLLGLAFEAVVTVEVRPVEDGGTGEPQNRVSRYVPSSGAAPSLRAVFG